MLLAAGKCQSTSSSWLCTLPRARGSVDHISHENRRLQISGWILHPLTVPDEVQVYVENNLVGRESIYIREDVATMFPSVAHAKRSGFEVLGDYNCELPYLTEIAAVGVSSSQMVLFRCHQIVGNDSSLPTPPPNLMMRVSGSRDEKAFGRAGVQLAIDMKEALCKYISKEAVPHLLDWGCGCGRVCLHLAHILKNAEIYGCDIDPDAVEWCTVNIPQVTFKTSGLYPPLPFEQGSFDAVIACSVMTHLSQSSQLVWLDELYRVLKPEGVLAASVHGSFASQFFPQLTSHLGEAGIIDAIFDHALDDVVPCGYYRSVFQTPEYTRRAWTRRFQIMEYIEAGLGGFQDVVVLRRAN